METLVELDLSDAEQVVLDVCLLGLLLVPFLLVLLNNPVEVVFIEVM